MAETLITSSALILGVCLLRVLLKGKMSPLVQYGMWSIVALRLILPWFYPVFGWLTELKSRFSVMNAAEAVREMAAAGANAGQAMDHIAAGQAEALAVPAAAAGQTAGPDWQLALIIIWGLGSLLLFLWMIWTNFHFTRCLYLERKRYDGDTYGATQLPVYCVENLSTPCFVTYLGERAIYLPSAIAEEGEKVRHVLVHEDCHARHHDQIWGLLRCVLLCYYWVNPLVWAAAFLSKRDCELACDASAVRRLGEEERFAYGRTLIGLSAGSGLTAGFLHVSSDLWNGKGAMKERISVLAKHPRMTGLMAAGVAAACIILIVCTYTGQSSGGSSSDGIVSSGSSSGGSNSGGSAFNSSGVEGASRRWAEAFCSRNGKELYAMYDPEHQEDFYEIEPVQTGPDDPYISFGWSSPWPMTGLYEIRTQQNQAEITYYAMTSDPHWWVWKEWLTWKQAGDGWFVEQERFKEYSDILSAGDFNEAYGSGIAGTAMAYRNGGDSEDGEALNRNAKSDDAYSDLFIPELAMEYLLNLHGGTASSVQDGDRATAVYTFPDGSRSAVTMVRPFGSDGIWVPGELADVPEAIEESGQETQTAETFPEPESVGNAVGIEDVVRFAGTGDGSSLISMAAELPEPDHVDGKDEDSAQNVTEHYGFHYQGENYELQVSYEKDGKSLSYIALQRLSTGEWLNIYRTPEDIVRYGVILPDEKGVREFFETHKRMSDYLTFRLPDELSHGGYRDTMGNGGGNLFLTSDPAGSERLAELSRYVDAEAVPAEWRAAGSVVRYTGGWPSRRIEKGSLMEVGLPWNHSQFASEPVSIADCEAPALVILVSHDMYTAASLDDVEKKRGPVPKENQTSRMWYVFFAEPDSGEMYSIALNADLYERDDVLKTARSVHFTDKAWTKDDSMVKSEY